MTTRHHYSIPGASFLRPRGSVKQAAPGSSNVQSSSRDTRPPSLSRVYHTQETAPKATPPSRPPSASGYWTQHSNVSVNAFQTSSSTRPVSGQRSAATPQASSSRTRLDVPDPRTYFAKMFNRKHTPVPAQEEEKQKSSHRQRRNSQVYPAAYAPASQTPVPPGPSTSRATHDSSITARESDHDDRTRQKPREDRAMKEERERMRTEYAAYKAKVAEAERAQAAAKPERVDRPAPRATREDRKQQEYDSDNARRRLQAQHMGLSSGQKQEARQSYYLHSAQLPTLPVAPALINNIQQRLSPQAAVHPPGVPIQSSTSSRSTSVSLQAQPLHSAQAPKPLDPIKAPTSASTPTPVLASTSAPPTKTSFGQYQTPLHPVTQRQPRHSETGPTTASLLPPYQPFGPDDRNRLEKEAAEREARISREREKEQDRERELQKRRKVEKEAAEREALAMREREHEFELEKRREAEKEAIERELQQHRERERERELDREKRRARRAERERQKELERAEQDRQERAERERLRTLQKLEFEKQKEAERAYREKKERERADRERMKAERERSRDVERAERERARERTERERDRATRAPIYVTSTRPSGPFVEDSPSSAGNGLSLDSPPVARQSLQQILQPTDQPMPQPECSRPQSSSGPPPTPMQDTSQTPTPVRTRKEMPAQDMDSPPPLTLSSSHESHEEILMTPASLDPARAQVNVQASQESSQRSEKRKSGLYGLFRSSSTKPAREKLEKNVKYRLEPRVNEPRKQVPGPSRDQRSETVNKQQRSTRPPSIAIAAEPDPYPTNAGSAAASNNPARESRASKRPPPPITIPPQPIASRLFSSTSRRFRTMSSASMEAIDGTANNTVVGSPTSSRRSATPSGPLTPPIRDPIEAARTWRANEDVFLDRGSRRRRRPGVTFDLEGNEGQTDSALYRRKQRRDLSR